MGFEIKANTINQIPKGITIFREDEPAVYVCVLVKSRFIERFINICIGRNIYLWDIRYKNECEANMKMSMSSFHKVRSIAKKTHSSVRIQKKKGLPPDEPTEEIL